MEQHLKLPVIQLIKMRTKLRAGYEPDRKAHKRTQQLPLKLALKTV